ncbi:MULTISPECIES: hypothetical protein [unclassified Duganella]|uniref:hypothetical protein n=1 Tax=unclassified Duganella TaxID=2636909 RepID=UPI000E346A45|nr:MULTISPECIES: hypothetical protein [unclassified Duganella]RFP15075.1 hypothetical protein D0T23_13885 [Duganella sp. BJB475]RFP31425.1 hypothetical protein D0T21_16265 [Duganella sp. BJB476]
MHPAIVLEAIGVCIASMAFVLQCYYFVRDTRARRTLIRHLASNPEFLQVLPHLKERAANDECFDDEFRKLRAIISRQIDAEGFSQPDELSSPMHQRPSRNRVRYIRGLVHEVEKQLRQ